MKQLFETKLKDKLKELTKEVNVNKETNTTEIGGNLEVDGKLKVNSGFDIIKTIQLGDNDVGIISEIDNGNGYSFIGVLLYNENGAYCIGYYEYDKLTFQYIMFDVGDESFYIQQGNRLTQLIDDEYLKNNYLKYSTALYRHDIVGKISDTESVSFTWLVSLAHSNNNYNTPIDSLTDLVNLVLVGKYTASGVINGKQVIQVIKSSNTTSGLKCLCVDGSEVTFNPTTVTDDVELLQ